MALKIGYFADGPWAHEAFKKIISDDTLEITFVCVRYDKRDAILIKYAQEYEIPILINKNINSDEFCREVKTFHSDIFVSMSFNQIFKEEIMNVPHLKTINCHAGKLPFYRGRNILNWVLINDEKEFGITVHYLDKGIDTGDIILQRTYAITDDDDYGTLLQRAYSGCAEVLYDAIKLIQNNEVTVIKQDAIDRVGIYCGMRREGDEILNWNQTSRDIFNFVRAICPPGPCARSFIEGKEIKIKKVRMVEGAHVYKNIPGQVIGRTESGLLVKTQDTLLEMIEFEYDGKVKMGDRLKER